MKRQFREINFRVKSRELIETLNEIIEDYQGQGLRLTLRQLYYQCITRNLFPNTEKSYKNLGSLLSDARIAGLVDWDAIEDRGREPNNPVQWDSVDGILRACISQFRLDRWKGQHYYVELWIEKQALAGVLEPLAREHHVTLMVNKGYSSSSAMYAAAQRYIDGCEDGEREPVLLYLGDLDPSGEDMVRDVNDRLALFGVGALTVEKLALTMGQVREFSPPPNPAKLTDSRAKNYIAKHGESSWEVDALPPQELARIIRRAIGQYIDTAALAAVKVREEAGKNRMRGAMETMNKDGSE